MNLSCAAGLRKRAANKASMRCTDQGFGAHSTVPARLLDRNLLGVRRSLARENARVRSRFVTATLSISWPPAGQIRMAVDSRQYVVTRPAHDPV